MVSPIRNPFGEPVLMRRAYGEALVELGRVRDDVVVLSADVQNSDFSYMFEQSFPDRFFNVGIAEPALVDVAVGMANSGLVPIAHTFAFLFATRALEMVRTHLCYGKANVKLAGAYAGLSDSFDGPTHHSITDIAIFRSLPGMTIVVPSDPLAVARLLPQVASRKAPCSFGYAGTKSLRSSPMTIGRRSVRASPSSTATMPLSLPVACWSLGRFRRPKF